VRSSKARWSSRPCTRGGTDGEVSWHRWPRRRERRIAAAAMSSGFSEEDVAAGVQ
jgi:hypothetical protein